MRLVTAIEWHCLSALGYTTAVMACAGDGGGPVTSLMNDWIAATGRVSDAALFLVPTPPDGTASAMYRHILSANIVISGVWLWFSKSYWAHWATEFRKIYGTSKPLSHSFLELAYATTVLGAFGAFAVLVYEEAKLAIEASWLLTAKWTFLRVPLLMSVCFALSCYAASFRFLLHHTRF